MKIRLCNNLRTPVIKISIGEIQPIVLDCLIDTGFTGSLAGFHFLNKSNTKQSSIGNVDYIKQPVLLPKSHWSTLANGSKVETWKAEVLCNLENQFHEAEIILISVAKPQPIPLILGMSLLKAYKANLSILFASNTFELKV